MSGGFDALGARYFDGDRPLGQEVSLDLTEGTLQIGLDDGETILWPVAEVRRLADMAGRRGVMLRWTGDPLARLYLEEESLLAHLPSLNRRAPPRGRGRLMAWALAAVAAVVLQIGLLVPLLADNLAGFIPPDGERALGEATLGHIRTALDESGMAPLPICAARPGAEALERMTARLAEPDQPEVTVLVLDHEMINAFALPGGFVVLFRGLIEAAEGPDQVAAVLAHEIGHVVSRDATRHALRSAGSIGVLGLIFGDFAGGAAVLFLTERLIAAQYSQAAETAADRFAHGLLERAEISPAALGEMFETLREEEGDAEGLVAHFLTHPALGARIAAAEAAVTEGRSYRPALSPTDWQALREICGEAAP